MLTDAAVTAALDASDIAYVAVESKSGPMVTPLLFTIKDGRLWMVMPSSSAKVTAIERNATVGVTVGSTSSAAVLQGEARLVDPLQPQSLVSSLPERILSPRAFGSYVTDNLRHLSGMVGPAALSPRTLAALRPERVLALAHGAITFAEGWTPSVTAPPAVAGGPPDDAAAPALDEVPAELAAATDDHGPVIVGWMTPGGPVALPATWDPVRGAAVVAPGVFEATGCLPTGPACVLFDTTEGTRLEDKTGLVLRGDARATAGPGADTELRVRTHRISWWQGAASHTVETA